MRASQGKQRSYAYQRRCEVTFSVGDPVSLKVSSTKGKIRFGKKDKLNLKFISPFEVLKRFGHVAYELTLLSD